MTAMSMGVGYLIAATGPAIVGAVRDLERRLDLADHRAARHDGRPGPGRVESCDGLGADRHDSVLFRSGARIRLDGWVQTIAPRGNRSTPPDTRLAEFARRQHGLVQDAGPPCGRGERDGCEPAPGARPASPRPSGRRRGRAMPRSRARRAARRGVRRRRRCGAGPPGGGGPLADPTGPSRADHRGRTATGPGRRRARPSLQPPRPARRHDPERHPGDDGRAHDRRSRRGPDRRAAHQRHVRGGVPGPARSRRGPRVRRASERAAQASRCSKRRSRPTSRAAPGARARRRTRSTRSAAARGRSRSPT